MDDGIAAPRPTGLSFPMGTKCPNASGSTSRDWPAGERLATRATHAAEGAAPSLLDATPTLWPTPAFSKKAPPVRLGFAMVTMHLPLVAIAPSGWDRWWSMAAIEAITVVLLAIAVYRYACVHRLLRLSIAELAAERRRFKPVLDSLIDPHVLLKPVPNASGQIVDFVHLDANPAACAWIGVDHDRLLGRRLLDVLPGLASTGLFTHLAGTANTGLCAAIESFPFPVAGGGTRWLDVSAVRIDQRVSLTWRDVTEHHAAVEKLAAATEQFRMLAENSSDVVARIDSNGEVLWVSPSIETSLGWPAADCVGRQDVDFVAVMEDREKLLLARLEALSGRHRVLRTQMATKGDGTPWVEIRVSPYRNAQGHVDSVVAALHMIDTEVMAQRILERRASTDELTQLLNRQETLTRIDALKNRAGSSTAVLWCDIDRFKMVNDTYGHAAGDAVLKSVADRIRGCLRSTDDIGARIGGDELLILLNGVHDLRDAADVAEKLRRRAAEPIPTAAGPVTVTLSIGVTLADAQETVDALLARADDAMYQAKKRGRNQVVAIPNTRDSAVA